MYFEFYSFVGNILHKTLRILIFYDTTEKPQMQKYKYLNKKCCIQSKRVYLKRKFFLKGAALEEKNLVGPCSLVALLGSRGKANFCLRMVRCFFRRLSDFRPPLMNDRLDIS